MKKVVYVRASKTDGVFSAGVIDSDSGECERLVLSVRRYPPLCDVRVGDFVDEELYSLMKLSDEEHRARKKALSLLSFSDNNERTLKRKLASHGISRGVADSVSEEMVSLGYINEKRQLERLIASDASKLYGPSKILARLCAKGYSALDIKQVMRELVDSGEIDFNAYASRLLEKKYPDGCSYEQRRALLYKHGYKSNK
jgi:SOS response regulatory protein OraA/RecX